LGQTILAHAVVRDPLDRFISTIGQALGEPGSSKNIVGKVLLKECTKLTCAETLNCIAKFVK